MCMVNDFLGNTSKKIFFYRSHAFSTNEYTIDFVFLMKTVTISDAKLDDGPIGKENGKKSKYTYKSEGGTERFPTICNHHSSAILQITLSRYCFATLDTNISRTKTEFR